MMAHHFMLIKFIILKLRCKNIKNLKHADVNNFSSPIFYLRKRNQHSVVQAAETVLFRFESSSVKHASSEHRIMFVGNNNANCYHMVILLLIQLSSVLINLCEQHITKYSLLVEISHEFLDCLMSFFFFQGNERKSLFFFC